MLYIFKNTQSLSVAVVVNVVSCCQRQLPTAPLIRALPMHTHTHTRTLASIFMGVCFCQCVCVVGPIELLIKRRLLSSDTKVGCLLTRLLLLLPLLLFLLLLLFSVSDCCLAGVSCCLFVCRPSSRRVAALRCALSFSFIL